MRGTLSKQQFLPLALTLSAVIAAQGCAPDVTPPDETPTRSPTVQLVDVDLDGLREAVAGHVGSVVLVDFWATWCPPCREAFPVLMDWRSKYASKSLVIITVSVDIPEDRDAALAFLEEFRPPFETMILNVTNYDDFVRAFDPEWSGGVPALFLYDRQGKRRRRLEGDHTPQEVEALFLPLLDTPSLPR